MVVCENLSRSAVFEILRPVRLTRTTIPHSKSLKSPFFPILMLGLNFSKSSSPHLDAKINWLISTLCYQAIEQVYLIKWPVSVYIYSIYNFLTNFLIYIYIYNFPLFQVAFVSPIHLTEAIYFDFHFVYALKQNKTIMGCIFMVVKHC